MADNNSSPKDNQGYTNDVGRSDSPSVTTALGVSSRTSSHDVIGQGIGVSKIGDIVGGNPASTNLGSGVYSNSTVPNAASGNFLFRFSDQYNRVILGVPDVSIYVGSSIIPANQWPNASYGMGNMPITYMNDWGLSDNVGIVTRVVVRNNSGADVNVFVVVRLRTITNSSPTLSGLDKSTTSQ